MLFDGVWARKAFFLSLGFLAFNCRSGLAQGNSIPTQISSASAPCALSKTDSAFIPVDSWIYPAVLRLYSMGYLHSVYIGERPWTRDSIGKMLDQVAEILDDARNYDNHSIDEAQKIYDSLVKELHYSPTQHCLLKEENLHIESVYSATRVLTGTTLRDSFHLGSTLINDYGRPYANGVNNYTGFSGTATAGRFLGKCGGRCLIAGQTAGRWEPQEASGRRRRVARGRGLGRGWLATAEGFQGVEVR